MLWLIIKILIFRVMSILSGLIDAIKEWQTMLTGAGAIIAAIVTISHVRKQITIQKAAIDEDKKRYLDSRNSKMFAKRAELLDALNELSNYAEECAKYFSNQLALFESLSPIPKAPTILPDVPRESIVPIKESIEFIDPQSAERMFELAVFFQIHNARRDSDLDTKYEISRRVFDALYLYTLVERLFNYARNRADKTPATKVDKEEFSKQRFILIDWSDHYPKLFDDLEIIIEAEFHTLD